ncbi:MAG: hypothetical protein ABR910_13945 [Acidobacteriaceae bacterium]
MKTFLSCACTAVLSMSVVFPCFAAGSPWDGTWKENVAKSKVTGDTMTFTMKAEGQFHYSNGGTIEYDFACDGKTYPTYSDHAMTCTGTDESGYDRATLAHGVVLSKSHQTFSPDGKMIMVHGTTMRPDGSSYTYDETYKRLTGTMGLAGKWLDVKETSTGTFIRTRTVASGMWHEEVPASKSTLDAKLDGTDATPMGPTVPPGETVSLKADGANKVHLVVKLNGKVMDEGVYTLSADGMSYTVEEWVPGKESEKEILVYEKQ